MPLKGAVEASQRTESHVKSDGQDFLFFDISVGKLSFGFFDPKSIDEIEEVFPQLVVNDLGQMVGRDGHPPGQDADGERRIPIYFFPLKELHQLVFVGIAFVLRKACPVVFVELFSADAPAPKDRHGSPAGGGQNRADPEEAGPDEGPADDESEGCALLVPDAVAVGRRHLKDMTAWRQPLEGDFPFGAGVELSPIGIDS